MASVSGINSYLLNSYNSLNSGRSQAGNGASQTQGANAVKNPAATVSRQSEKKSQIKLASDKVTENSAQLGASAVTMMIAKTQDVRQVSGFVKNYNKTIDSLENVNDEKIGGRGNAIVKTTASFKKSLEKIGIGINTDNSLSLDRDTFENADPKEISSLFSGNYSYGAKLAEKAEKLSNTADTSETKGTYNEYGKLSSYYNDMLTKQLQSALM